MMPGKEGACCEAALICCEAALICVCCADPAVELELVNAAAAAMPPLLQVINVTPRYAKLHDSAGAVFGWENMELISGGFAWGRHPRIGTFQSHGSVDTNPARGGAEDVA